MNIHPLFVHFPVALLSTYAVFELLRFKKITSQNYWFYVKAVLVIAGTLGACVAYLAGDEAKHLILQKHADLKSLIALHENWALVTLIIFAIIASSYTVVWLKQYKIGWLSKDNFFGRSWKLKIMVAGFILNSSIVLILAFVGLVALTITGALGGSIIYGHSGDPFTAFVYSIFFR